MSPNTFLKLARSVDLIYFSLKINSFLNQDHLKNSVYVPHFQVKKILLFDNEKAIDGYAPNRRLGYILGFILVHPQIASSVLTY